LGESKPFLMKEPTALVSVATPKQQKVRNRYLIIDFSAEVPHDFKPEMYSMVMSLYTDPWSATARQHCQGNWFQPKNNMSGTK
jgi:hypothetical protein